MRLGICLLVVLVGDKEQDAADDVNEDQGAYTKGGGVGLGALVNAPAVYVMGIAHASGITAQQMAIQLRMHRMKLIKRRVSSCLVMG